MEAMKSVGFLICLCALKIYSNFFDIHLILLLPNLVKYYSY